MKTRNNDQLKSTASDCKYTIYIYIYIKFIKKIKNDKTQKSNSVEVIK
jgi:hypothetical protein